MNCNDCNRVDTISMAAHETIMSREDKKNRRLIWVVVLLIVALVATNIAWLVTWNSYDINDELEAMGEYPLSDRRLATIISKGMDKISSHL